ncbi:hypothetical protein CVM49_06955 [Staphylococcus pseudintermedius]|nr:thiocillin family RiPP [Staphylococcus pseudintermedius]EGQ1298014.1 thiocillin family RiPP [Staphylococcus pseudintermedius]EGQ1660190.1 thiocillin family RiPP [Staphylococcus pseudintermedius]EGQ1674285.1 thiocillin family RiPP [Staphylococcus pseudintermedius]EGQ1709887.1 thiocillin family RiPP [Staphylococcus pseudintermedius]EGQ1714822.1 thiocillin family RiPP [Staphylococcus pseudintermedius]
MDVVGVAQEHLQVHPLLEAVALLLQAVHQLLVHVKKGEVIMNNVMENEKELELYVDELNIEEVDFAVNFNCAGSVFTGASFACAGSCGSSVSSAGSFSSATG